MIQVSNSGEVLGNFKDWNEFSSFMVNNPDLSLEGCMFTQIDPVPVEVLASINQTRMVNDAFKPAGASGNRVVRLQDQKAQRKLKIAMRKQQQAGKLDANIDLNKIPVTAMATVKVPEKPKKESPREKAKRKASQDATEVINDPDAEKVDQANDMAANAVSWDDREAIESISKEFSKNVLQKALGREVSRSGPGKIDLAIELVGKFHPMPEKGTA
jgi:hypothetical protein